VLNLRLDGDRKPAEVRISVEDVVALDIADEKRMKEWHEFCDKFIKAPSDSEYLYQCGAGLGMFHIDPYGQLSACMMSRIPSYDLRQGTFHDGWRDFMPQVRMQKWLREMPCKTCELISLCGQCPGWAQMEKGDQETPVEYLCQIAHKRSSAFGYEKEMGGELL
jgi:radical SAM protein with 4Fe4S-binding SPASM domain